MTMQEYINKVQNWIDQGRLKLPRGSVAYVNAEDGAFYIRIEHYDNEDPPVARAAEIRV